MMNLDVVDDAPAAEKYNYNRHIWDVKPEALAPMSKVNYAPAKHSSSKPLTSFVCVDM